MDDKLEDALRYIDTELATAILNESRTSGFNENDIPEDDSEKIEEAKYWVEESYKAYYDADMRQDVILAILNLAGLTPNPGYTTGVPATSSGGFPDLDVESIPVVPKDDVVRTETSDTHKVVEWYGEALPKELRGLPIPQDFDDDPQEMPKDISDVTDKEVRRLHGVFNAYLARAKWLTAIETGRLQGATHLRDHAYRLAVKKIERIDPKTDKPKTQIILEAEANEDPEFVKLNDQVMLHKDRLTQFKALAEIYAGNVDRLSREWTMRNDEYNKTR